MTNRDGSSPPVIGFLTVIAHAQHGYFGGYLVLNHLARPLEFHCTAPVKPNRAQEILYGATLEAFLFGEQIGQTLVAKSAQRPAVVCTDQRAAIALRNHVDVPVAVVLPAEPAADESAVDDVARRYRLDAAHGLGQLVPFSLSGHRLAVPAAFASDEPLVAAAMSELAERFDLREPFDRIRGAIEEAQRGGK